jgi:polysaccharide export outer membrane protein
MFTLMGAVRTPGQYQMMEPVNLLSAIMAAGGLDFARAGDHVIIQRASSSPRQPPGSEGTPPKTNAAPAKADATPASPAQGPNYSMTIDINLKELLEKGNRSLDVPVEPGDIVTVSEKLPQVFYIIGDVNRPGQFPYPEKEGIKLSLAMAMAGGPARNAKLKKTVLLRQKPGGTRQEIAINLKDLLNAKRPDIDLRPNDLIFVPGSTAKNIAYGLLGMIPTTAQSAVYTVVR